MANGYGICESAVAGERYAHRVSWILVNGPIPEGKSILHRCDVRRCIRPKHLYLGTDQNNSDDKMRRGQHGRAKITKLEVVEIRRRAKRGATLRQLAEAFQLTRMQSWNIKTRRSWRLVR